MSIIQGNNKQDIFNPHQDYKQFITCTKSYLVPHADIIAWCLLPNHFYFMIVANEKSTQPHKQSNLTIGCLTNGFRKLISAYAHDFNKKNNRSGSLFRPKTKAKDISIHKLSQTTGKEDYCLNCFYHIHQNPLRHQIVADPGKWMYSSYPFYAGNREKDFCNKQLAAPICEYDKTTFDMLVKSRLPDDFLHFIEAE